MKVYRKETVYEGVDKIHLACDKGKWWAVMYSAMFLLLQ